MDGNTYAVGRFNAGQLAAATLTLQRRWEQTQAVWTDEHSREFDKRYMTPLAAKVSAAIAGADELARLLRTIHAECDINNESRR